MSYDYHTYQDYKTGHNAPLFPRPDEEGIERTKNMNFTLQYLLNKGALPEKTTLGVPLYGRSFILVDEKNNTIGSSSGNHPCEVSQIIGHLVFSLPKLGLSHF